jgi:hypothetical protein
MSLLHPSRVTRGLLKIASFGLAGLLAGLLSGCNSGAPRLQSHNDTDWQTSSTYASATAAYPPHNAARSARNRPCFASPCESQPQTSHARPYHHL